MIIAIGWTKTGIQNWFPTSATNLQQTLINQQLTKPVMQCHMRTMHQPHIAIGVHSNHEYLNKKESSLSHRISTHTSKQQGFRCIIKWFQNFVLMKLGWKKCTRLSHCLAPLPYILWLVYTSQKDGGLESH